MKAYGLILAALAGSVGPLYLFALALPHLIAYLYLRKE